MEYLLASGTGRILQKTPEKSTLRNRKKTVREKELARWRCQALIVLAWQIHDHIFLLSNTQTRMIQELKLQNIRIFRDEHTFSLKNLTVFTGTNSSGKSTILKMLPLLRQTQGIRESVEYDDSKLRLKGTQVDLGRYETLVSDNDADKEIGIGVAFSDTIGARVIRWLEAIKAGTWQQFKWDDDAHENPLNYVLHALFTFACTRDEKGPHKVKAGTLLKAEFDLRFNNESIFEWSLDQISSEYPNTARDLYKLKLPKSYVKAIAMLKRIRPLREEDPDSISFIAAIRGILPSTFFARAAPSEGVPHVDSPTGAESEKADWEPWPLPNQIMGLLNGFKFALQRIHYIAPLRSPGKRLYIADFDVSPGMDPTGEFLPFILRDKGHQEVTNFHPHDQTIQIEPLQNALSYWLTYLRSGKYKVFEPSQLEIDISSRDVLIELKLQSPVGIGKFSLADSGFGYSQIMPILTRGLLMKVGDTLVVEQPELHLHPALQVRIAVFFLAMARSGKQVLLETHSEHLVNALRIEIAEKLDSELAGLCKIHFIELTEKGPIAYDLSVREDGTLDEWPDSFFGEALELSSRLLRAQRKSLSK
jgi:predicted ATPase